MNRSETFEKLPAALAKFQAEVKNPALNKENPHFRNKYADLSEVLNSVRPILTKNGLSVYQNVSSDQENVIVTTILFHESGEYLESDALKIPAGRGGKAVDAQGIGSAASYAKRYQIQACLGITAEEEDDGESFTGRTPYQAPKSLNTPNQASLAAKYQLVMGSRDGFEDYVQGLREKGHDDQYILLALDKALEKKKKQGA